MSHAPVIAEEIERKAVEEIERLVHSRSIGKITQDQYEACVVTLWNAVSGLVSRETMNLLTLSQDLKDGHGARSTVVLRDGKKMIVVSKPVGQAHFVIAVAEGGTVKIAEYKDPYDDHLKAQQKFDATVAALEKSLCRYFPV